MSAVTIVLLALLVLATVVGLGLTVYSTIRDEKKYGRK